MASRNRSITEMAGQIVSSFVSHTPLNFTETSTLTTQVAAALSAISNPAPAAAAPVPAVSIKNSITPDFLICLEDGRLFKSLKRHLRSRYNMSPDEYRAKWGLPADYPMVAPNYSKFRSELRSSVIAAKDEAEPAVVPVEPEPEPVVETKASEHFTDAGILCLIDNKIVKDLGRHVRKHHGLSAVEYRTKFALPVNYPMTLGQVPAYLAATNT